MKNFRVWFNHWFSSAYHIINLLKEDDKINFIIIGSNTDNNCVYRHVCNEWSLEPIIENDSEYVEFCIDFCKKNKIDVFVPRRCMVSISKRLKDFDDIGVLVLVERDYSLVSVLSDKAKTYEELVNAGIDYVPPYYVVNNADEFSDAYKRLKNDTNRICIKYSVDEGAVSFREIDDTVNDSLKYNGRPKISYDTIITILSNEKNCKPLIVMPYLSGIEISVDCLYRENHKHIIIPRHKSSKRSETIRFDKDIIEICNLLLDNFKLKRPCNLQFRYNDNKLYLLEINTRMSGGIQLSCKSTGINIPNIAVNQLLGFEKKIACNEKTQVVSYVEMPVILE